MTHDPGSPVRVVDARGREIVLARPPRRIVSLVPSQTELLADLRLDNEVVGITRFCVRPAAWRGTKRNVGGTKQVRHERVEALQPDFVLANREENTREDVERLERLAPVYVTDVRTVDEAVSMIRTVGRITGRGERATSLARRIEDGFRELERAAPQRVVYLIWRDPLMTIGGDTFIHDVLSRGGFRNPFGDRERYPEVSNAEIRAAAPDWIALSSEPYPFKPRDVAELAGELPGIPLRRVDGQLCSWYGSRLAETPAYLRRLRETTAGSGS